MKLLAIETATEALSVAVNVDGQTREKFAIAPRQHAELCLPWCDELLAEAGVRKSELDVIAVGRGPGAFTGVRLAMSLVQGMALALDKPVIALSTLQILAMRAKKLPGFDSAQHSIIAAIDARMDEIYCAHYVFEQDQLKLVGDEVIVRNNEFPTAFVANRPIAIVGTGLNAGPWREVAKQHLGDCYQESLTEAAALPHASDLVELALQAYKRGEAQDPANIEPAYLRNKVALTLKEQGKA
jgi:tRNA threonylcarbamoyladenosine biosynthesis protein TsaB